MKELLELWAELEPDRCGYDYRDGFMVCINGHSVIVGDPNSGEIIERMPVQCAVQQAVEGHEWQWTKDLRYIRILDPKTFSMLAELDMVRFGSFIDALLSAYLQALRTTKQQEVTQ